jgi:integrase
LLTGYLTLKTRHKTLIRYAYVELTRLGKQSQVQVKLREHDRTDVHPCTFVFNQQIASRNGRTGHHNAVGSINQSCEAAIRRAGIL